jgi:hypothetical protein
MKVLLYTAAAVILVVLIGSRFIPHGKTATSVSVDGNFLIGWVDSENHAWVRNLGAPIQLAIPLSSPAEGDNRFIVSYGGLVAPMGKKDEPGSWYPPKVVIYSATGQPLMEPIDLLSEFNPFKGQYEDKLYELFLRDPEDLDCDGYTDGIVRLQHHWFPELIYFISGAKLKCTGGFANSGRCEWFATGPEPIAEHRNPGRRLVGVLAKNNRMGYQGVVFRCRAGRILRVTRYPHRSIQTPGPFSPNRSGSVR